MRGPATERGEGVHVLPFVELKSYIKSFKSTRGELLAGEPQIKVHEFTMYSGMNSALCAHDF